MKKLLSTLLCLSVVTGIAPLNSSALSEPIYIEDGAESKSGVIVCGDIDNNGQVSMSDLVTMYRYFMNGNVSPDDDYEDSANIITERLDVNLDGSFDVFDITLMRQFVLHPDTASRQEWSIDIFSMDMLKDDDVSLSEKGNIITTYEEYQNLIELFNNIGDNNLTEVLEKHKKYDGQFFEENNLIVMPFMQERGNGVFYEVKGTTRFSNLEYKDETLNGIALGIKPSYKENVGLYPVADTPMIAQITVPKYQCNSDDKACCLDFSKIFAPDISSCSYKSPDGETEIFITQKSFLLAGDINLYIKNSDGSFNYLTYLYTDDGCQPFSENGEWSVDDDGNNVFGDGEYYSITWKQDGVILDHLIDNSWEKIFVSFDGETIQREFY